MARKSSKTVYSHGRKAENSTINCSLPKTMKAKLMLLALKERRSLSSWLVLYLDERLDAEMEKAGIPQEDVTVMAKALKG